MKKISIIILTFILMLNVLSIFSTVNAVDISIIKDSNINTKVDDDIKRIGNHGIAIISTIGVGIAVIMLIVVAIKYMTTAPSERAEIKKYLVIFAVGAIFIFCCVGVVNIIAQVAKDIL